MGEYPPGSLFMDGAQVGRNDWWRYLLSVVVFVVGYLGGGMLLFFAADAAHQMLASAYPEQFSDKPLMALVDLRRGWRDAPIMSGLLMFATFMGSVIIAIPVLAFAVKYIHRRAFKSLLGDRGFDGATFAISFVAGATGFAVITGLELLLFWDDISFNKQWTDILLYLPIAILVVPLQVLAEELFFRGYLLQAMSVATKRLAVRIIVPALAFALLHYDNAEVQNAAVPAMAYFVIFSLYITWVTTRVSGISAAVGFHLAMNMVALFIISSSLSAYISPTLFYVNEPVVWTLPLEIISVIAIYHILMKRWRIL